MSKTVMILLCLILMLAAVQPLQAQGNLLRELKLDSLGQGVSISEPGTALLEIISPIDDTLRFDSNIAKKLMVERLGNRYWVTCPSGRQIITILASGFMNLNIPVTMEANKSYYAKITIVEEAADVMTDIAMIINSTSALLKGVCNPKGLTTNVYFEYGLSRDYGFSISGSPPQITGMRRQSVNGVLEDLEPGMTYHFRIVAKNNGGTTYGADQTFSLAQGKKKKGEGGQTPPQKSQDEVKQQPQARLKTAYSGFWSKPNLLTAGGGAALAVTALILRSSANASYDDYEGATTADDAAKFRDQTEKKDTYTTITASLSALVIGYSAYKYFTFDRPESPVSIELQHGHGKTQVALALRF